MALFENIRTTNISPHSCLRRNDGRLDGGQYAFPRRACERENIDTEQLSEQLKHCWWASPPYNNEC